MPDFLPVVSSHSTTNGILDIPNGEEVHFSCHESKFVSYPEKNSIKAFCENGVFRILDDNMVTVRLCDLGCQTDHFEDVLHEVEFCPNPYQGRSYQHRHATVFHLAEICYDAELGQTTFAHMSLSKDNNIVSKAHIDDQQVKLSILGNFNMMIDKSNKIEAQKVYDNNISINKKLRHMLDSQKFNYADQILVATKLLPSVFFGNQNGRVANFVFNKAAVWRSVAKGNLKSLQDDIVEGFKRNVTNVNETIEIYVGTHEVLSLSVGDRADQHNVYLKPGKKYPVPKYIWTVVYNKHIHKAVALVIVNNPFISISEIRQTVFCPSLCNLVNWTRHLKSSNNYERSAYGLVFCCDIHSFAKIVKNTPNMLSNVHTGERGVLKDGLP